MIDDDALPATSKPAATPAFVWAGVMVALTLGASAAGAGLGLLLGGTPSQDIAGGAKPPAVAGEVKYSGETSLRELPPIIANLAEPSNAWVRVQASIVFDRKDVPKADVIAAKIGEDILGFMRTLSEAQLGGASGLQHLREDLNERASIRSGGVVRELIMQTLVVQ
jgi:flagellar FliL protein